MHFNVFRLFLNKRQYKTCESLTVVLFMFPNTVIPFEKSKLLQSVLEQVCVTPDEHFILFLSCDLSSRRESLAVYHLNKGLLLFR